MKKITCYIYIAIKSLLLSILICIMGVFIGIPFIKDEGSFIIVMSVSINFTIIVCTHIIFKKIKLLIEK